MGNKKLNKYAEICNKPKEYPDLGDICQEAYTLINGDRQEDYGKPEDNFQLIANFWNDFLKRKYNVGYNIKPRDVTIMMILLKVARETSGYKRDTLVDICGYAGLAEHLQYFE